MAYKAMGIQMVYYTFFKNRNLQLSCLSLILSLFVMVILGSCRKEVVYPPEKSDIDNTPNNTKPSKIRDFYYIFTSDPQLHWVCTQENTDCQENADGEYEEGELSNKWQVESIKKTAKQLGEKFKGVIINGDLTAFGHWDQYNSYRYFYHDQLQLPVYPGLGNHDYENNVNDCARNNCAIRMVHYLIDQVKELRVKNFDLTETNTYYQLPSYRKDVSGSLAYSWDVGAFHFVQLNNNPSYQTSYNGWNLGKARRDYVEITSSFKWLKKDLADAKRRGKQIIINSHKSEHDPRFEELLRKYSVTAIFHGHEHSIAGLITYLGGVPVYYSGSSSANTYLLVHFVEDQIESVQIIDARQGRGI